jgi:hypothetical protein
MGPQVSSRILVADEDEIGERCGDEDGEEKDEAMLSRF